LLSIYSSTCNPLYPQSTLAFDFSRYDEHICVWESPYRGFLTRWKSKYSKPIACFLLILHRHISHSKRWNQNSTNLPLTVPLSMNSENLMHAKQSNILKDFWCLFACVPTSKLNNYNKLTSLQSAPSGYHKSMLT